MTEKSLVSVIINCYNSEKYLRETIDSLISQTYKNWEAIFWDNCSTDKTAEIIASYNEPRFRYFLAEKNTPLGEARNLAMENVQGELLCFLDSDDVWDNDFLKIGVSALLISPQIVGYYSNYFDWTANGIHAHNTQIEDGIHDFRCVLKKYGIGMSSCIVRTEVVKKKQIVFNPQYSLIEDLDFFLKLLRLGDFLYNSTPLSYYRLHSLNESKIKREQWAEEYEQLLNTLYCDYVGGHSVSYSLKDLECIRNKMLYYKLENCINDNNRLDALKILLKNKNIPIRYWSRIIFVILGSKIYNIVKRCGNI